MAREIMQCNKDNQQIYFEKLNDLYSLTKHSGWKVILEYLKKEIEYYDLQIDDCERDMVDRPRGGRKALKDLMRYVDQSVDKFNELNK